jgi:hypothetical protein
MTTLNSPNSTILAAKGNSLLTLAFVFGYLVSAIGWWLPIGKCGTFLQWIAVMPFDYVRYLFRSEFFRVHEWPLFLGASLLHAALFTALIGIGLRILRTRGLTSRNGVLALFAVAFTVYFAGLYFGGRLSDCP